MMQPAAKAGTPAAAAAAAASTSGQQANAAAEALAAGLQLGGAAAAAAGAGPSSRPQSGGPHRPPRVSGYSLEPDLAKDVAAAAAAEQPGGGGRSRLHLVVLGHVDAGKSTLMGRLLHDLGQVGAKEVQRNQREAAQAGKGSFAWAWVLDERPEERARGVTVDVAMSHFTTPRFNVTLLDAPGHRDFVPNMITGAAQADAALLLVDGSPGGFEAGFGGDEVVAAGAGGGGGQTREHAQLARSLGIEQLAVVISKLDTVGYSQARFREVQGQLLPFLKGCGFREGALQWLPAVGPSGQNLAAPPTEAALKAWWSGPTVVQAVDSFQPRERATERPLRLPVSDVTTKGKQGGGVGVGGKLEGGAVRVGTKVALVPSGEVATVKAIEVDGQLAALARAGDTADLTLQGLDPANLFIGAVLCHPAFPVPLVAKFEARLVVLDVAVPILKGQNVTIHAHTAREAGHVSALLSVLDAKTGEVVKRNPRCLVKGQTAIVQVTPARAMCLEEYADYRALGRVALRDGGRTVAVGVVSSILG